MNMFSKKDKFEEIFDSLQDQLLNQWESTLNKVNPKRVMYKKDNLFINDFLIPGLKKEDIKVKNNKDQKIIYIKATSFDEIIGKERTIEYSYNYPKDLILKSTKYLNGILYLMFESANASSTSNAEDVKVED